MQICLADADINLFIFLLSSNLIVTSMCWRNKTKNYYAFNYFSNIYVLIQTSLYFIKFLHVCYINCHFADAIVIFIIFLIILLFYSN